MSEVLTSNITVDFSSKRAEEQLKIETDDRDPALRIQYLRVFPSRTGTIFATTGTLTRSGYAQHDIEETVSFNNSNEATLNYPGASQVSIDLLGSFYQEGSPTTTNLSYDAATNRILSTKVGFGVAKVTYKAEYTLYRFVYDGIGCPYEEDYRGVPGDPAVDDPYEDSLVIVFEASEGDYANVNLTGPECSYTEMGGDRRDSRAGKLILEIDKEGPAAITVYQRDGQPYGGDIAANALIRLYPDVAAEIESTHGKLVLVSEGKQAEQKETVNLTVSNGLSLKYPEASGIEFFKYPGFVDEWDRPLTENKFHFKHEGESVFDVNWVGPDGYTGFPQERIVQPGEIVIVDNSSYVIKVTGIATATYTSTYRLYAYEFDILTDSKARVTDILDADILATYHKPPTFVNRLQSGSMSLSGPSIKGADEFKAPDVD